MIEKIATGLSDPKKDPDHDLINKLNIIINRIESSYSDVNDCVNNGEINTIGDLEIILQEEIDYLFSETKDLSDIEQNLALSLIQLSEVVRLQYEKDNKISSFFKVAKNIELFHQKEVENDITVTREVKYDEKFIKRKFAKWQLTAVKFIVQTIAVGLKNKNDSMRMRQILQKFWDLFEKISTDSLRHAYHFKKDCFPNRFKYDDEIQKCSKNLAQKIRKGVLGTVSTIHLLHELNYDPGILTEEFSDEDFIDKDVDYGIDLVCRKDNDIPLLVQIKTREDIMQIISSKSLEKIQASLSTRKNFDSERISSLISFVYFANEKSGVFVQIPEELKIEISEFQAGCLKYRNEKQLKSTRQLFILLPTSKKAMSSNDGKLQTIDFRGLTINLEEILLRQLRIRGGL